MITIKAICRTDYDESELRKVAKLKTEYFIAIVCKIM